MNAVATPSHDQPDIARTPVVAGRRFRRVLLWLGSPLTVLFLGFASFNLLTLVAIDEYQVVTTFSTAELSPVEHVAVTNHTGRIEVVGTSTGDARLEIDVTDGLFRADREERVDGDTLRATASCTLWFTTHCRVDQRLWLPADLSVEVRGEHGDVAIDGVAGALRVNGRFGELNLVDTSGPTTIDHGFGSVTARGLTSTEITVSHRFGDTLLSFSEPPDEVRVDSRFGTTTIELPDDGASYRVTGRSTLGDRRIEVRTDVDSERTIHVDSRFGDVTIRYASGNSGG